MVTRIETRLNIRILSDFLLPGGSDTLYALKGREEDATCPSVFSLPSSLSLFYRLFCFRQRFLAALHTH